MRALERGLGEEDAVVGQDRNRVPHEVGEAAHQRIAVERLELLHQRAVDDPGDHLAHLERPPRVGGDDAVQLGRVVPGLGRLAPPPRLRGGIGERASRSRGRSASAWSSSAARWSATPLWREWTSAPPSSSARHVLAGRRLHERRPAEEDRAGAAHDHGLVAHRRHVGAAGRARPHHDRDLGDARGRHAGLVVEDAAEVVAVGEYLGLQRQVRPARVGQVDAGQVVLGRHLLRPQVLLDGQREVASALDGGVVCDDDARPPAPPGRPR